MIIMPRKRKINESPLQGELFGHRTMRTVYTESLKNNTKRKGPYHPTTVGTNLKRQAAAKGKMHLTIWEALQAEKTRIAPVNMPSAIKQHAHSIVVMECLLKALKDGSTISIGRVRDMSGQIAVWERQGKIKKAPYTIEKGRYDLYKLLKLTPEEVLETEIYLLTKKIGINEKSPLPLQKETIKQALTNTLRVVG